MTVFLEELGMSEKEIEKWREEQAEIRTKNRRPDILEGNYINLSENDNIVLKDVVDDTILWIHVKEKIKISDYVNKIDEVNNICNTIIDKYNDEELDNVNISKRHELEDLCYSLKSGLDSNLFEVSNDSIKLLDSNVTEIMEWLIENQDNSEELYSLKIDELNKMCSDIYNSMVVVEE